MDVEAAKMIGAGIAAIALGGAGVGIGTIFGNYLAGALRNPAAAASQRGTLFLGFAFAEATGLIGFAVVINAVHCRDCEHSELGPRIGSLPQKLRIAQAHHTLDADRVRKLKG